ncbi:imelysin family protein [Lentisphaera profundi]|uniref:Imelysin family protein n=1 Tax=Lentisphaera profundi TaxID=1658616 RepID=A0ABY7VY78_9BACT|nr:imelysin family protein [Lentisphaera profundi]WDE99231.1 imelysin family protein [Lentisphaera profundi]
MKSLVLQFSFLLSINLVASAHDHTESVAQNHAQVVYLSYMDTLQDAQNLQKQINQFSEKPSEASLEQAKKAWLQSRESYGQTEAFRFYDGPIDFANEKTGEEGPEGELNAWPVNEAFMDYVKGAPTSGIINSDKEITLELINSSNIKNDEADVTTGYHAIEFLLWGQDLSLESAGIRPASDYKKGDKVNERRRLYLNLITQKLISDLQYLVTEWTPKKDNFRKSFEKQSDEETLSLLLTSLATLSAFEMGSERMGTALDSGDQEDEHSCFSDNTHRDFITNQVGMMNVYFGNYGSYHGKSPKEILAKKDEKLANKITKALKKTADALVLIPAPIDRVLASEKGSEAREIMEAAISALNEQAELFVEAGKVLKVDVKIIAE